MSLKDALQKAGFKSSKSENERQLKPKKKKTEVEVHQEHRNFCEVCELIHPDVERFVHRHPRIDAQWICLNCVDKNEILDDFRKTQQSDVARNGRYRRYYGHTRDLNKEKNQVGKDNRDQNRKPGTKFNKPGNQTTSGNQKPRYKIDPNGKKNFNC